MSRIMSVGLAAIISLPIVATPLQAEVCSITLGEEHAAMATLSRAARDRMAANRAALIAGRSQFGGFPPEIQMALVRDRAPNLQLPASFSGRADQSGAMRAAADSARDFRSALERMASATTPAEIAAGRDAARAAMAANAAAYEGFVMSTGTSPSARVEAGELVRSNTARNARLTEIIERYAVALEVQLG